MMNQSDGSRQEDNGKQGKETVPGNAPRNVPESEGSGGVKPVRIEREVAEKNIPPDPDPDDPVSK